MLPFGKVMVYLAFNCNLNTCRGRPRLSQWDQTASGQKPGAVPKFFATSMEVAKATASEPDFLMADPPRLRISPATIVQYRKIMPHVDDARKGRARARAGARHVLYNDVHDGLLNPP